MENLSQNGRKMPFFYKEKKKSLVYMSASMPLMAI